MLLLILSVIGGNTNALELFGVDLQNSQRDELRRAAKKAGVKLIREGGMASGMIATTAAPFYHYPSDYIWVLLNRISALHLPNMNLLVSVMRRYCATWVKNMGDQK